MYDTPVISPHGVEDPLLGQDDLSWLYGETYGEAIGVIKYKERVLSPMTSEDTL